jgi:flagellar basal body-associated protein FliL
MKKVLKGIMWVALSLVGIFILLVVVSSPRASTEEPTSTKVEKNDKDLWKTSEQVEKEQRNKVNDIAKIMTKLGESNDESLLDELKRKHNELKDSKNPQDKILSDLIEDYIEAYKKKDHKKINSILVTMASL